MTKTLPQITIKCRSTGYKKDYTTGSYAASWQDSDYRYHVNIHPGDKGIEPTIHRNALAGDVRDKYGRFPPLSRSYKALDMNAKVHATVKAEIERLVTAETLAAAWAAQVAADEAHDAMMRAARAEGLRVALRKSGDAWLAPIAEMDDADLLRLVQIVRSA